MAVKQWVVADCDKDLAANIAQQYNLDPLAALLAVSRGIRTDAQIRSFFLDSEEAFSDPFAYKDMDKAVLRINRAIDNFERIAVFGDYDADGVTATAMLSLYLSMREANFFCLLPERAEGYGLNRDVIDRLHAEETKLIITVDNGINAVDEAVYAKSLGMDMVITDHHQVGDVLPDAAAVVNPHRPDCAGASKDLAGVGVAFKLVCALEGDDTQALLDEFADLAAIGTVADIVPLVGENRALVRRGIRNMIENPRPGIAAMREKSGNADKPFTAASVAFTLSPRLNAVGRMGSAMRALDVLLCEDETHAAELAQITEQANAERQKTEQTILEAAVAQLEQNPAMQNDRVLVVDGEGWHRGVIGIVASRMVEKYGKPCIVISREPDVARGSGRSIDGFSLYDALSACAETLEQFGGHTLAAGLSVRPDRIADFRAAINRYASRMQMPFPLQKIDMKLNPAFIQPDILNALQSLEPCGAGNPRPVFGLFSMHLDSVTPLAGGKHIRLNVSKKGSHIAVLCFGVSPQTFPFPLGSTLDIAVSLEANVYMGETRVSVLAKQIRFSALGNDEFLQAHRLYAAIRRGQSVRSVNVSVVPDRAETGRIYKAVRSVGGSVCSVDALCVLTGHTGLSACTVLLAVDALCELGLMEQSEHGELRLLTPAEKANLEDSAVLRNARACFGG